MRVALGGRDAARSQRPGAGLAVGRGLLCASFGLGLFGCGGGTQQAAPPSDPPAPTATPQPPASDEPPIADEPQRTPEPPPSDPPVTLAGRGQTGGGGGSGKSCSIKDSNGPLPGGTSTTVGCDPGERCECNYQAGYSCGGVCVAAAGNP